MNKSALKIVLAFSIVIQLIAIFLFYITHPSEVTFIPIAISYACGVLVFVLSLISFKKRVEEEGSTISLKLIIIIYAAVSFILLMTRIIILIVS